MAAFRHVARLALSQARAVSRSCTPRRALATASSPSSLSSPLDTFADRHIGPDNHELSHMLSQLGYDSMDAFVDATVPSKIRVASASVSNQSISSLSESELFRRARELGGANKPFKSYIGMGYHNAVVPPVILRNVWAMFPCV